MTSTTRDAITTQQHTGMLTLAAITALLDLAERTIAGGVAELARRHPFVQAYCATLADWLPEGTSWADSKLWWQERLAEEEAAEPVPPLVRVPALQSSRERIALALVALPEEDARFLAVLKEMGIADPAAVHPAMVAAALDEPGQRDTIRSLERMRRRHLIQQHPGAPGQLRTTPGFWSLLRDDESWAATLASVRATDLAAVDHWDAAREVKLRGPLEALGSSAIDTLVVRGVPGAEAPRVISAVLKRPVLWLEPDQIHAGPGLALAQALGAVPGVKLQLGPGERAEAPRPDWYRGPLLVVTGTSGGLVSHPDERRATVLVDRCNPSERRKLWAALLPQADDWMLDALVGSFALPDGHIRRLAADAQVAAGISGRSAPTVPDIRSAALRLGDVLLETTATRLVCDGLTWDDVVTPPIVRDDLELIESRCRLRERLGQDDRGMGGTGVRVMFTGPSGCGKTLAARVLGSVLDRGVYRVDLASVFDKYVGVTEKILDSLLTEAEQLDVVLLLDEGDTLLGSRTDVRSANDRYANLETNFLLQRLETYSGIVVVTTNTPSRIDSAFARRMDATVAFAPPGAAARRRIWELHLPSEHELSETELAALANGHRLTGGRIRNAVQHARLLSARSGTHLTSEAVSAAVTAEYRKAGVIQPPHESNGSGHSGVLRSYLRNMAAQGQSRRGGAT